MQKELKELSQNIKTFHVSNRQQNSKNNFYQYIFAANTKIMK